MCVCVCVRERKRKRERDRHKGSFCVLRYSDRKGVNEDAEIENGTCTELMWKKNSGRSRERERERERERVVVCVFG